MSRHTTIIHRAGWAIIALLTLITAYGGYLRFADLGSQSLWIDEGFTINAAQGIAAHGYPLLGSGEIYSDWLLPDYLIAGSMRALGFDPFSPWSARIPMALFGTMLVVMVFVFTRSLFENSLLALAAAALTTFSQWEIAWSGQARGYTVMSFFVIFGAWCAWEFMQKKTWRMFAGAVIAFVCAYFTSALSLLVVPAFGFFWLSDAVARKRLMERLGLLRFSLLCVLIFVGAIAFFELAVRFTSLAVEVPIAPYLQFLGRDLLPFTLGSVAAAIFGIFDKARSRPVLYVSLALFVPILFVTAYSPVVQLRYLFPFFPFALVLLSYAVYRAVELSGCIRRMEVRVLLSGALALLFAAPHLQFLPESTRILEYGSPQPDFKTAYAAIAERAKTDCPSGDASCFTIVSPYADLTHIYLNTDGEALLMSLTGKVSDIKTSQRLGKDFYTGAPLIQSTSELATLLDTKHGFIVLDGMALDRLPADAALIMSRTDTRLVYRSGTGFDQIRLYEFGVRSKEL